MVLNIEIQVPTSKAPHAYTAPIHPVKSGQPQRTISKIQQFLTKVKEDLIVNEKMKILLISIRFTAMQ